MLSHEARGVRLLLARSIRATRIRVSTSTKGISYEIVDLSESDAALEYVKELGYAQAPVVVVDDQDHWSGFRPDKIERIAAAGVK